MKKFITLSLSLLLLSACVTSGGPGMIVLPTKEMKAHGIAPRSPIRSENGGCVFEDFEATVSGVNQCLIIEVYKSQKLSPNPTLAVFVHGDGSSRYRDGATGRWEDLIESYISNEKEFENGNYVLVSIIRPAYKSWRGLSSGFPYIHGNKSYTHDNIAEIMGAIERLTQHFKADKVIAFGSSGGSATISSGLGLHPTTSINEAVFIGCPCDLNAWSNGHGWGHGTSVSPRSVIGSIRKDIKITALVGTKDDNTYPALSRDYVSDAKEEGLDASYIEIPDGDHLNARWKKEFIAFFRQKILGKS